MSYQPVVPASGLVGWRFLQRTLDRQQTQFANGAEIKRDLDYFKANIATATTAEKLVADRRLLKVALGAFGLGAEIDKKAFVRKMLEGSVSDPKSLTSRIVDRRYREMVTTFRYGETTPADVTSAAFADQIAAAYRVRAFEEAVGRSDETLRLALNFDREIQRIAASTGTDRTVYFTALGDKAIRAVLEKSLGFPDSFGTIDIDKQVEMVAAKLEARVGSGGIRALTDPAARETVIRGFLARAQAEQGPNPLTPGYGALQLLQSSSGFGGGFRTNLFLSRL